MAERQFDPFPMLATLWRHHVDFVVIGAVAAIAQGYPLTTRELDVTPSKEPTNVERLADALRELGARLRTPSHAVEFPVEAGYLAEVPTRTLLTGLGELDVVFAPTGTQGYADLRRDAIELTLGVPVLVASLRDVIRMKEASHRDKDKAQLPALRRTLELVRRREREQARP